MSLIAANNKPLGIKISIFNINSVKEIGGIFITIEN